MDYPELVARLRVEEGVRHGVYKDSLGISTIGVGFNIDDERGGGLDDVEIDFILAHRLAKVVQSVANYPWFAGLSRNRQMVVLDMVYNLGYQKFTLFHGLIHSIAVGDWQDASRNMLASNWAHQVGQRADKLAKIMETDVWDG